MRGFPLLFFGLWFRAVLCFAQGGLPAGPGRVAMEFSLAKDSNVLTVDYVATGGPADIAGIKNGDGITAINGVPTRGMSLAEARHSLTGEIGSVLKLTVSRPGSPDEEVSIVRKSFADAYSPAAEAGDPKAEFNRGYFLETRPLPLRDLAGAAGWYRKAADQGYAHAQAAMGRMYFYGRGVAKDQAAATAWYRKAAMQGDAAGERGLGFQYFYGNGVPQSYKDAFAWFYSAAMQGIVEGERDLALRYYRGEGVAQSYKDAFAWFYSAAMQGDVVGERYLALQYYYGRGAPKNYKDAFAWFYSAAVHGGATDENTLALRYYTGEGVAQSDKDAFAWFYSAAVQDDPEAEQYLGALYRDGRGVIKNDSKSFAWYYRSAQFNNPYGEWGLAYMYQKGRGVKPDVGEALKWYQKAQAGLPQNEKLKKDLAHASLKAFLENPAASSLDSNLIMTAFRRPIVIFFDILTAIYIAGGIVLVYFTLEATTAPPGILVSLGWVVFYLEGQGVSMLALLIFGKSFSAESLFGTMALVCALPVIISTCGPGRHRVWKASPVSWKMLFLYAAGAYVGTSLIFTEYHKIYTLFLHASVPSQSTRVLITKAKHASSWLSYGTIGLIMPVAEEIMFRSYLFDAFRRRFSGAFTIIATAFIFSLIHFQLTYFVPLFGFGVVLGWVRLKTDSLRLPALLHAINNSLFLALSI